MQHTRNLRAESGIQVAQKMPALMNHEWVPCTTAWPRGSGCKQTARNRRSGGADVERAGDAPAAVAAMHLESSLLGALVHSPPAALQFACFLAQGALLTGAKGSGWRQLAALRLCFASGRRCGTCSRLRADRLLGAAGATRQMLSQHCQLELMAQP